MICQRLTGWTGFQRAACVAAYMPLPHEADVVPALRQALAEGKRLLLPGVRDGEMRFYAVTDLDALTPGAYGVREPARGAREVPLREAELILTPLEAVDRQGRRLGKGGGYYDRALRERKGMALGVALSYQVLERVPATDWDISLDGWADPAGIHILREAR